MSVLCVCLFVLVGGLAVGAPLGLWIIPLVQKRIGEYRMRRLLEKRS
jgi:hypothetical protein